MKLRPTLTIEAEITVDNWEAQMLLYLTDFSLAEWFVKQCSTKYTVDEITKAVEQLRKQLRHVVEAHDRAMLTIMEKPRGNREEIS